MKTRSSLRSSGGKAGRDWLILEPLPPHLLIGRTEILHIYWRGQSVALSSAEARVVGLLASSPGVEFSHEQIYEAAHPGRNPRKIPKLQGRTRVLINRLRAAFRGIDRSFDEIENHYRLGYRWKTSHPIRAIAELSNISPK